MLNELTQISLIKKKINKLFLHKQNWKYIEY